MAIPPDVLRAMRAAGASAEVIIAAVEADQAIQIARLADRRAKAAARRRARLGLAENVLAFQRRDPEAQQP